MKKADNNDEFERRRYNRQRRIKKRRLIIFFVAFILIMLTVGITLSLTIFFPIEQITATGSKIYTEEQIVDSLCVKKGDNIFTISKQKIEETLRSKLPYIETVTVKRKLPGSISLSVKDSKEYACYNVDGEFFVTNADGFVLNKYEEEPESIIKIRVSDVECKVGTYVKIKDQKAIGIINQLVKELSDKDINADYLDVTNTVSITAGVENRFIVDLGTSNNLDKKIAHLAGMIKNIEGDKTGEINLSMWSEDRTEGTFIEKNIA